MVVLVGIEPLVVGGKALCSGRDGDDLPHLVFVAVVSPGDDFGIVVVVGSGDIEAFAICDVNNVVKGAVLAIVYLSDSPSLISVASEGHHLHFELSVVAMWDGLKSSIILNTPDNNVLAIIGNGKSLIFVASKVVHNCFSMIL